MRVPVPSGEKLQVPVALVSSRLRGNLNLDISQAYPVGQSNWTYDSSSWLPSLGAPEPEKGSVASLSIEVA